jgi:predicted TIM-barrel fold metal-dependent hydrolase
MTLEELQEIERQMNIDLNFTNNPDMRLGCYDLAIRGFKNVLESKPDHQLAAEYLRRANEKLQSLQWES